MSLDGKIATRSRDARWISGEVSRAHAHVLRDRSDAVIVGIGTVLADDPSLTVRPAPADGHQPHRIVVDTRLRMPLDATMGGPELAAGTTVAFAASASGAAAAEVGSARALEDRGFALLALPADASGRVDLWALLDALGERGYNEVLVEGRRRTARGILRARARR